MECWQLGSIREFFRNSSRYCISGLDSKKTLRKTLTFSPIERSVFQYDPSRDSVRKLIVPIWGAKAGHKQDVDSGALAECHKVKLAVGKLDLKDSHKGSCEDKFLSGGPAFPWLCLLSFPFPLTNTSVYMWSLPPQNLDYTNPLWLPWSHSSHTVTLLLQSPMPMAQCFLSFMSLREDSDWPDISPGTESPMVSQAVIIRWPHLKEGHFLFWKKLRL